MVISPVFFPQLIPLFPLISPACAEGLFEVKAKPLPLQNLKFTINKGRYLLLFFKRTA